MTKFPTSLDHTSDPPSVEAGSTDTLPGPGYLRRAIIAVETKLGIGDDTPEAGQLLTGGAGGASSWAAPSAITEIGALEAREELQRTQLAVSSAELLAIHTTPLTIVAAPGADTVIVPTKVLWSYTDVGVDYAASAGSPVLQVLEGSQVVAAYDPVAVGADQVIVDNSLADLTLTPNTALTLDISAESIITGDGTLEVTVWYVTETV